MPAKYIQYLLVPVRVHYHFFLLLLECNLTNIILISVIPTLFHATQM